MAGGARPDPFRTRKLSRRAPMVLRGKPVGEQGAADRWTALPYRCRAGPSGAPLLCLSSRRGGPPGPPAWAGGPFPSVGSAVPVLAGLGPSGKMRLAGAGAPAAPVPFQAPWKPPAGESAAKPVKCPRRGAGALYARSGEGGAARRLPTAVRARPIIPSAVPMAGPADGPATAGARAPSPPTRLAPSAIDGARTGPRPA